MGDGDSSAYSTVDRERPYSPTVFIKKEECVNHITKRMGTNLRRLIKENKGKKTWDGKDLSGKGRLSRIDAIQSFYRHAIHNNKGSLSWCSYQIDIANGTNSYKPPKYPIAHSIAKVATPIFKRLAPEVFLEGCKNVSNQNANEFFNNVLWSFCPKEQFNSLLTASLAISLAICVYNSGLQNTLTNLLEKCNLQFHNKSLNQWYKMDK